MQGLIRYKFIRDSNQSTAGNHCCILKAAWLIFSSEEDEEKFIGQALLQEEVDLQASEISNSTISSTIRTNQAP